MSKARFWWRLSSCWQTAGFSPCPHMTRKLSQTSFARGHESHSWGWWLTESPPKGLIPSHGALEFQHINTGGRGHKHSDHTSWNVDKRLSAERQDFFFLFFFQERGKAGSTSIFIMLNLVIFVKRPIELQLQNKTCNQKFRQPSWGIWNHGAELLLSDWMMTAKELGSKCLLVWSASCPGTLCPSASGAGVLPGVSSELASAPLQILSSRRRLYPCKCVSAVLQSEEPYLWA